MGRVAVNCMVRNAQETVYEALVSTGAVADEVVVFDTGSTDHTITAIKAAQKVLSHKKFTFRQIDGIPDLTGWSYQGGSFLPSYRLADVRNSMIDATESEWIWVVDADEVYTANDAKHIRTWIRHSGADVDAIWLPLMWICFDGQHIVTQATPTTPRCIGRIFRKRGMLGEPLICRGHFPGESYWRGESQILGSEKHSKTLRLPDGGYRHYECMVKPFRRRILNFAPYRGKVPEVFKHRPDDLVWPQMQSLPVPGRDNEEPDPKMVPR